MHHRITRSCQRQICLMGVIAVAIFLIIGLSCLGARNYLNGDGNGFTYINKHGVQAIFDWTTSDAQTNACWIAGIAFSIILVPISAIVFGYFIFDYNVAYHPRWFEKTVSATTNETQSMITLKDKNVTSEIAFPSKTKENG